MGLDIDISISYTPRFILQLSILQAEKAGFKLTTKMFVGLAMAVYIFYPKVKYYNSLYFRLRWRGSS